MLNASALDLIVSDFDGLLTNNRVLVLDDGGEADLCTRADGLAFDTFREKDIPVCILSTETSPVAAARRGPLPRLDRLPADLVYYPRRTITRKINVVRRLAKGLRQLARPFPAASGQAGQMIPGSQSGGHRC